MQVLNDKPNTTPEREPSAYSVIPSKVLYDKKLSSTAKLLYAIISGLCNLKGFCWASNAYLSSLMGVNEVNISRNIAQLVHSGYIIAKLNPHDHQRTLKINEQFLSKKIRPLIKNDKDSLIKNDKQNIIINNNIYNNISEIRNYFVSVKGFSKESLGKNFYSFTTKVIKDLLEVAKQTNHPNPTALIKEAIDWTSKKNYSDWTLGAVLNHFPEFIKTKHKQQKKQPLSLEELAELEKKLIKERENHGK